MSHPYERTDQGDDRDRDDERRRAERDAAYGQPRQDDPGAYDRYEQEPRHGGRGRFEDDTRDYAERARRGFSRMAEGVRRAFDTDRPGPYGRDPRRGGGMFGGEDRRDSLFSHDDGLRADGPHRGKGPKGYARSDARILEDINDRLTDDGRLDASEIEVRVEGGEVTLSGFVHSREGKRRAEDIADRVSGVGHLQNNLRVHPPHDAAAARTGDVADNPQGPATSGQNAAAAAGSAVGSTGATAGSRTN